MVVAAADEIRTDEKPHNDNTYSNNNGKQKLQKKKKRQKDNKVVDTAHGCAAVVGGKSARWKLGFITEYVTDQRLLPTKYDSEPKNSVSNLT